MGTKVLQMSDSPHGDNFKCFQVLNIEYLKLYLFSFWCVCLCSGALIMCLVCLKARLRAQEEGGTHWLNHPVVAQLPTKQGLAALNLLTKDIVNTHTKSFDDLSVGTHVFHL